MAIPLFQTVSQFQSRAPADICDLIAEREKRMVIDSISLPNIEGDLKHQLLKSLQSFAKTAA